VKVSRRLDASQACHLCARFLSDDSSLNRAVEVHVVADQLQNFWAGKAGMGVISYWIKDPKLELPPLQKISLREAETEGWDEGTKKYAKVQAVERYMSERAEREQQLQTQYANINQQLSTELMDHLEAKPEYVDVDEKKDPIALWKLVIGCVYVRPTGVDQLDIVAAMNTYMSIKQGPHETLSDYKHRFVSYAQALEVMWERQVTKAQNRARTNRQAQVGSSHRSN
jgi:hypothetical protein